MISLLLLAASLAFGQQVSTETQQTSLIEQFQTDNQGKDIRALMRGRYSQTGKPTFRGGFCFADGTCQTSAGGAAGAGLIVAYATSTIPSGWLECNGVSYLITSYQELYDAIGCTWGCADGTHFNVPDLRGRFPRGWDHTVGHDPDSATRTASATGGSTGDNVGSYQADQTGPEEGVSSNGEAQGGAGKAVVKSQTNTASETRPKNVYVTYIIKTSGGLDTTSGGGGTGGTPSTVVVDAPILGDGSVTDHLRLDAGGALPAMNGSYLVGMTESQIAGLVADLASKVNDTGDTMTGPLLLDSSLRLKSGPWFDVTAFGAVGDNATDNCTAMSDALNAAAAVSTFTATQATVYVPVGRFASSCTIEVPSFVNFTGDGFVVNHTTDAWMPIVHFSSYSHTDRLYIDANNGSGVTFGDIGVQSGMTIGNVRIDNIGGSYDAGKGAQFGVQFSGYDFHYNAIETFEGFTGVYCNQASDIRGNATLVAGAWDSVAFNSCEHIMLNNLDIDTYGDIGLKIDGSHDVQLAGTVWVNNNNVPTWYPGRAVQIGVYSSGTGTNSNLNLNLTLINAGATGYYLSNIVNSQIHTVMGNGNVYTDSLSPTVLAFEYATGVSSNVTVSGNVSSDIPTLYTGTIAGAFNVTHGGNSIFGNGKVGIGNTNPSSYVHIIGSSSVMSNELSANGLAISASSESASLFMGYDYAKDSGYISAAKVGAYRPILLNPRGTNDLSTLDGLGNVYAGVGIGISTSPGAALGVGGSAYFTSTVTVQGNAFSVGGATLNVSGGNVGMGTSGPTTKLHMSSGILTMDGLGAKIKINSDDSGVFLKPTSGASNTGWHMQLRNSSSDLGFTETGVADGRLYLKAGGNVGVGITDPGAKLHVAGDSYITGAATFGSSITVQGESLFIGTMTSLNPHIVSNVDRDIIIDTARSFWPYTYGDETGYPNTGIYFDVANGAEELRIQNQVSHMQASNGDFMAWGTYFFGPGNPSVADPQPADIAADKMAYMLWQGAPDYRIGISTNVYSLGSIVAENYLYAIGTADGVAPLNVHRVTGVSDELKDLIYTGYTAQHNLNLGEVYRTDGTVDYYWRVFEDGVQKSTVAYIDSSANLFGVDGEGGFAVTHDMTVGGNAKVTSSITILGQEFTVNAASQNPTLIVTTANWVGIGTYPSYPLEVRGETVIRSTSSTATNPVFMTRSNLNAERVRITNAGRIGLAVTNPQGMVHGKSSNNVPVFWAENIQGQPGIVSSSVYVGVSAIPADLSGSWGNFADIVYGNAGQSMYQQAVLGNGYNSVGAYTIGAKTRNNVNMDADVPLVTGDEIYNFIALGADGNSAYAPAGQFGFAADGDASAGIVPGRLTFQTADIAGALTERMRIDSAGNVGINTTAPQYRLHVASGSAYVQYGVVATTGEIQGSEFSVGGSTFVVTNGNVAIGTGTPNYGAFGQTRRVLTVSGTGGGVLDFATQIADGSGNPVGQINFFSTDSGGTISRIRSDTSGTTAGNRGGNMYFYTKADGGINTERMRIDNAGNIGINTTSPAMTLDVNGSAQLGSGATKSTFTAAGALTLASTARVGGNIYTLVVSSATPATTNETDLVQYTVPAGMLGATGEYLHVRVWGYTNNNANVKTLKSYYGSSNLRSQALTINSDGNFVYECYIYRTSASNSIYQDVTTHGLAIIQNGSSTDTPTHANANVIRITGTSGTGTASDILVLGATVVLHK